MNVFCMLCGKQLYHEPIRLVYFFSALLALVFLPTCYSSSSSSLRQLSFICLGQTRAWHHAKSNSALDYCSLMVSTMSICLAF